MPLTTAEQATLLAAVNAIPVSDVDVGALQQQLAEAQATIATQASTIEALNYGIGQMEARILAGRAKIAETATKLAEADQALT